MTISLERSNFENEPHKKRSTHGSTLPLVSRVCQVKEADETIEGLPVIGTTREQRSHRREQSNDH